MLFIYLICLFIFRYVVSTPSFTNAWWWSYHICVKKCSLWRAWTLFPTLSLKQTFGLLLQLKSMFCDRIPIGSTNITRLPQQAKVRWDTTKTLRQCTSRKIVGVSTELQRKNIVEPHRTYVDLATWLRPFPKRVHPMMRNREMYCAWKSPHPHGKLHSTNPKSVFHKLHCLDVPLKEVLVGAAHTQFPNRFE